jgi:zinc transport system permease protein
MKHKQPLVLATATLLYSSFTLDKYMGIASDALLGILSHSSLAIGLVVISFFDDMRIDLLSYFFGDLLAVN